MKLEKKILIINMVMEFNHHILIVWIFLQLNLGHHMDWDSSLINHPCPPKLHGD